MSESVRVFVAAEVLGYTGLHAGIQACERKLCSGEKLYKLIAVDLYISSYIRALVPLSVV